jgi:hypothetical protein
VHSAAKTSWGRSGGRFTSVVDSLLDDGLSVRFRAGGRSMTPTVRDGEYLIVAPVDPARVKVGDVVFCHLRRGPIAHRVCAIEPRSDGSRHFILYGDASLGRDPLVASDQLRGQVVGVERNGLRLHLADFLGGRLGRAAFMIALALRRSLRNARIERQVAARAGAAGAPATAGP